MKRIAFFICYAIAITAASVIGTIISLYLECYLENPIDKIKIVKVKFDCPADARVELKGFECASHTMYLSPDHRYKVRVISKDGTVLLAMDDYAPPATGEIVKVPAVATAQPVSP